MIPTRAEYLKHQTSKLFVFYFHPENGHVMWWTIHLIVNTNGTSPRSPHSTTTRGHHPATTRGQHPDHPTPQGDITPITASHKETSYNHHKGTSPRSPHPTTRRGHHLTTTKGNHRATTRGHHPDHHSNTDSSLPCPAVSCTCLSSPSHWRQSPSLVPQPAAVPTQHCALSSASEIIRRGRGKISQVSKTVMNNKNTNRVFFSFFKNMLWLWVTCLIYSSVNWHWNWSIWSFANNDVNKYIISAWHSYLLSPLPPHPPHPLKKINKKISTHWQNCKLLWFNKKNTGNYFVWWGKFVFRQHSRNNSSIISIIHIVTSHQ